MMQKILISPWKVGIWRTPPVAPGATGGLRLSCAHWQSPPVAPGATGEVRLCALADFASHTDAPGITGGF